MKKPEAFAKDLFHYLELIFGTHFSEKITNEVMKDFEIFFEDAMLEATKNATNTIELYQNALESANATIEELK